MEFPRPEENETFASYLNRFMVDPMAIIMFPEDMLRQEIAVTIYNFVLNENVIWN